MCKKVQYNKNLGIFSSDCLSLNKHKNDTQSYWFICNHINNSYISSIMQWATQTNCWICIWIRLMEIIQVSELIQSEWICSSFRQNSPAVAFFRNLNSLQQSTYSSRWIHRNYLTHLLKNKQKWTWIQSDRHRVRSNGRRQHCGWTA